MSAQKKLDVLRLVESCDLPTREILARLDLPASTYYRWRRRFRQCGRDGLMDRSPRRGRGWNELLPEEEDKVYELATLYTEWSSREIACHIGDHCGFSVSESTVYRLLKKRGLDPGHAQGLRAHRAATMSSADIGRRADERYGLVGDHRSNLSCDVRRTESLFNMADRRPNNLSKTGWAPKDYVELSSVSADSARHPRFMS